MWNDAIIISSFFQRNKHNTEANRTTAFGSADAKIHDWAETTFRT